MNEPSSDAARVWILPEPQSVDEVPVDDETRIVLRRHGNSSGPRLVLSHGNGLAIDLYMPFWSLLGDEFDLVLYDLRNHGWNTVTPLDQHNIPTLVRDHDILIEAIFRTYGDKPTFGAFHSVSGLVSLLSAAKGARYSGLVLYDPPLCKPGASYAHFEAAAMRAAAAARRRTTSFKSPGQFAELLQYLPMFQRAVPGVLDLVARTTLRVNPERLDFNLRCPREYEAQIIDYASAFAVLVDFASLHCPVKVIGADPTLPYSYLPTLDLSEIVEVDYDFLPETTHFLPVEKPEDCASGLRQFLHSISSCTP